jgi:hypothetical protein
MDNKYVILNSAMMPSDGKYVKRTISKNQFIDIIKSATEVKSSIGYQSVSDVIKKLTGISIDVNRDITIIPNGYNVIGLHLDHRVAPDEKGSKNPSEDDYVYFIAIYTLL